MTTRDYKEDLIDCVKAVVTTGKGLIEIYTAIDEVKVSQTDGPAKLPSNVKRLSQTTDSIAS